ncbi:MAG TPA: hypothetical protein VHW64_19310 [Nocardioides sp.]|uniref:DUF6907 domain-containing protein n=1 Tax=Nocardioides sp. TaxID=35761 RepID=UPI002E3436E2|nr:hypothetical protein [Nocardioides sp.]HEX3932848.1 hypothetical protein [Nocardioides sp.]
MITAELNPSEIQFTCPPWCRVTREEHLQDLSNHEGRCIHWSADREGRNWALALSGYTYPDGTPADDEGLNIELSAQTMMTPTEARRLAAELIHLADTTEPLNHEAFTVILEVMETTLEEAATVAGVDLSTATRADAHLLSRVLGLRLTGRDDTSVSIEAQS